MMFARKHDVTGGGMEGEEQRGFRVEDVARIANRGNSFRRLLGTTQRELDDGDHSGWHLWRQRRLYSSDRSDVLLIAAHKSNFLLCYLLVSLFLAAPT